MKYAFSFTQIREADARALRNLAAQTENGGIMSANPLMERAGACLAEAVYAAMVKQGSDDVLFVCGGGNNGGDGFIAARILLERGIDARALCMAEKFSPDCLAAKNAFKGEILSRMPRKRYAVVADCLFGTGLNRPPEGENAALIDFINGMGAYVVACDVPSGLGAGGIIQGKAVSADETVCMGLLKQELLLSDGPDCAGKISVADIGIRAEGGAELFEAEDIAALLPKRKSHSNKGSYGRAAILGGYGPLGAPLMAAGGCLKSGAGYTELWIPFSDSQEKDEMHRTVLSAKYPACIVKFYAGEPFLAQAVAYGMGANVTPLVRETLQTLLTSYECGVLVLDADALNALAAYRMHGLLRQKKCRVIITPHIREFSRLTGKPAEEILSDPVGCARAFSQDYGVVTALKNNRTVITDGERVAINTTGSPALSKGGSGDVLSGLIAGSCARGGISPYEGAVLGCYLLGKAGEAAEAEMGAYAPDAGDIISFLPAVMRAAQL